MQDMMVSIISKCSAWRVKMTNYAIAIVPQRRPFRYRFLANLSPQVRYPLTDFMVWDIKE